MSCMRTRVHRQAAAEGEVHCEVGWEERTEGSTGVHTLHCYTTATGTTLALIIIILLFSLLSFLLPHAPPVLGKSAARSKIGEESPSRG